MLMTHEITNQSTVLVDPLRASAVGHTGRLDDRRVAAHVVDNPNEAVVQNMESSAKDRVELWRRGACQRFRLRLCAWCAFDSVGHSLLPDGSDRQLEVDSPLHS